MMTINPEYEFGDTVYFVAANGDEDFEMKGAVLSYEIYPGGQIMYEVRWADMTRSSHYGFELSSETYIPNPSLN